MAEGRHFENSFISISRELSDFDQIWIHTDANFYSEHGNFTQKIEIFQIQYGAGTVY